MLVLFVFVEVVYFVYVKHLQTKPAKFKKLSTKVTFQILEKASLSLEKKETRGLDIHTFQVSCVSNLLFQSCIRSYTNKGPSRVPPDSRGMLNKLTVNLGSSAAADYQTSHTSPPPPRLPTSPPNSIIELP